MRAFRRDADGTPRELALGMLPFRVYGPTCDTLDLLPRPLLLSADMQAGDFIVFEAIGAYSVAVRTNFNGFFPDTWVVVE